MALSPYQPQNFLRHIDINLLKQYFAKQGILQDFDFSSLNRRDINSLFEAWRDLDEKHRGMTEVDFQNIHNMSHKAAHNVLIKEALTQGEDLIKLFDQNKIENFHNRAFWVFLERKNQYWDRAKIFTQVESISNKYWKKLRNLDNNITAKTDRTACNELKRRLSDYFFSKQARGKGCTVEYLERITDGQKEDYFFIYPENYADSINDWDNGQMHVRTIHPAFELIFFYNQHLGELELYCPDIKLATQIKICQEIFCQTVLGIDFPKQSKDKSYELSHIFTSYFDFDFDPQQTGIKEVLIQELFVEFLRGKGEKLRIYADNSGNPHAVYDFLTTIQNAFLEPVPLNFISTKFRAVFMDGSKRDFTVSSKNSCSLGQNKQDRHLKQMLIDSGIQLTSS